MHEIAVVILNYRTARLTIDCLASLESQIEPDDTVVVVDNDSADGSAERIEAHVVRSAWSSWVRVLRAPSNGGFAAGNNVGIRAVDARAYVLLNSDTIVLPGALAALKDAMRKHSRVGLIGPRFEGENGASTFRFPSPMTELVRAAQTGPITRLLKNYDVDWPADASLVEPEWIGFACVLVPRTVIEEVGLLDERYFMYFEDIDYCRRVRKAGYRILYWPEARVIHLLGASSNVTSNTTLRRRAPRYFYESRARYFASFYGLRGLWLANLLWGAGRCVALPRELVGNKRPHHRDREGRDIWTNAFHPFRPSTALVKAGSHP